MEFNEREITIFCKPGIKKDKNTYVLASQISSHIKQIDVCKDTPTETQLLHIIDLLGVEVEKLIERESDIYKEKYKNKSFDLAGWVQVMVNNPDIIKTPIAIKGKKAILVETPSNVLELDPEKGYNKLTR